MAKLSKFKRSQLAHRRLNQYHKNRSNGNNHHFVKMNYHLKVMMKQSMEKRVLSEKEKRNIYNNVISTFF